MRVTRQAQAEGTSRWTAMDDFELPALSEVQSEAIRKMTWGFQAPVP